MKIKKSGEVPLGTGQEDSYPVAHIEKLECDMPALPDIACGNLTVPRLRGQQRKDPAQLGAGISWFRSAISKSAVRLKKSPAFCKWLF